MSDFKEIEEEWKTQMSMKASAKDETERKTQNSEKLFRGEEVNKNEAKELHNKPPADEAKA